MSNRCRYHTIVEQFLIILIQLYRLISVPVRLKIRTHEFLRTIEPKILKKAGGRLNLGQVLAPARFSPCVYIYIYICVCVCVCVYGHKIGRLTEAVERE